MCLYHSLLLALSNVKYILIGLKSKYFNLRFLINIGPDLITYMYKSEYMLLFQFQAHDPQRHEGELDFGTMGVKENRSVLFNIINDNPVEVSLSPVHLFL